jgi:4-diphosphocytidyl-2-C-methyl-D-erythritol kinase
MWKIMSLNTDFKYYKSFAKINIFLEIVRKRKDGYHDIESLFGRISLYDEIFVKKDLDINVEVINNVNADNIDVNSNLVYKAFVKFRKVFNINDGVYVKLVKNIPVGSGLGGGSSNCAYALRAYSEIFGINDEEKLEKIATELGSDVLFFWKNCSFALVSGRGEIVEPVDIKEELPWILIVFPNLHISTKDAYASLNLDYTPVKNYWEIREKILSSKEIDFRKYLFNRLESVSFKINRKVEDLKNEMLSLGLYSLMSGSGSSVFGLSHDKSKIENAFNVLKKKYHFIYLSKFV